MVYTIKVPAGVMELVDVVDSKSTDGDIVPVRVRPPAPKKEEALCLLFFWCCGQNSNNLNATVRWTVAGSGRCATQPRRGQGAHRAPQQDTRHQKKSECNAFGLFQLNPPLLVGEMLLCNIKQACGVNNIQCSALLFLKCCDTIIKRM